MAKITKTAIATSGDVLTEEDFSLLKSQLAQRDKEIRTLKAEKLTEDNLVKSMSTSLSALPAVKVKPWAPKHTVIRPGHEEDQVLLFSDLHAGEVINKDEVDGFNEYNFDIMCRRLWGLTDSVLSIKDLHSHAYKVKRLWVLSLGDIVTGEIHNMAETNSAPIISTMQQTALVVSQALIRLASSYDEIVYVGVAGNHDRRHEKPRTKQGFDNWAYMVNWAISLLCAQQKNIRFHIPKSPFLITDIRGWNFLVRHGHGKVNSFAGIPFYGLSRKNSAFQELYRSRGSFDYEVLGHYHQQAQLKDDRVFINGSIIGANEFAINELAAFSPPSQKLMGVDDKHGVTYNYKLTLQEYDDKPHGFVYNPDDVFEHQAYMADFISTHFDTKKRR